jgi:glycerate-2-kinase
MSPLSDAFTNSAGGGSALLPAPIPPVTLEEKQMLTKLLAARGATIQELNTIRKALSQLKGGGLAQAAYPAQVNTLFFLRQPRGRSLPTARDREMKA